MPCQPPIQQMQMLNLLLLCPHTTIFVFFSMPPSKLKPVKPEPKIEDPKKQKKFEKEEKEFRKKFKVLCIAYPTTLIRLVNHPVVCCLVLGTYHHTQPTCNPVLLKHQLNWPKWFHGPILWCKRCEVSSFFMSSHLRPWDKLVPVSTYTINSHFLNRLSFFSLSWWKTDITKHTE